jgi:hypothetical protein
VVVDRAGAGPQQFGEPPEGQPALAVDVEEFHAGVDDALHG